VRTHTFTVTVKTPDDTDPADIPGDLAQYGTAAAGLNGWEVGPFELRPDGPHCAYCGVTGPANLFEPFNERGNLACRAQDACQVRVNGGDPAYRLSFLLRAVRRELEAAGYDQLIELAIDLDGYRGAVIDELSLHPDWTTRYRLAKEDRAARAQVRAE
jgi:hypothetical protein